MSKNRFAVSFIFSLLLAFCFAIPAKTNYKRNQYPAAQNEKFVIRSLVAIHSAQITYQVAYANGNYGTFENLRQADLVDSVMATGDKYGYRFTIFKTDYTATAAAGFYITATPRLYRKTGRNSFYIDEKGEIFGADKNGEAANASDPLIDSCFSGNERCAIRELRNIGGAEATYATTNNSGNYGTFNQLYNAGLISRNLAVGARYGYLFVSEVYPATATMPASFKIRATPANYGVSGVRSFYIDESGIIRGADKHGAYANADDPPIEE